MAGQGVVNLLASMLLITSVLVAESRSVKRAAYLYAVQALVLAGVFLSLAVYMHATPLYLWSFTAVITKAVLVPYAVLRALRSLGDEAIAGESSGLRPVWFVMASACLVGLAILVVEPMEVGGFAPAKFALAVSVAHFMTGLLSILTRPNAVKQIFGYCLMENGSHLTLAVMAYNAPETVEIGILTDAILAVVIMAVLARRMHETCGTLDTDQLTSLRG